MPIRFVSRAATSRALANCQTILDKISRSSSWSMNETSRLASARLLLLDLSTMATGKRPVRVCESALCIVLVPVCAQRSAQASEFVAEKKRKRARMFPLINPISTFFGLQTWTSPSGSSTAALQATTKTQTFCSSRSSHPVASCA